MQIILFWISCLLSQVVAIENSYSAAVVEYYPLQDATLSPEERLNGNTRAYIDLLKQASKNKKLDIIVFPESTITWRAVINSRSDISPLTVEIQDEPTGVSLCSLEDATFLSKLACAAKSFKTYLVVNLYERSLCKSEYCAENGWDFYNTNVVFDREGAVVAKYRKYNLFGEYHFNQTEKADITIFKTDFGVTFGTFICFDLLFRNPALELAKKHEIGHIAYPTMWFSELPFLTALQAQHMWNFELDTVMLASGANNPRLGSGGTGIFLGHSNSPVVDILGKETSSVYVTDVPIDKCQSYGGAENERDIDLQAKVLDDFYLKVDNVLPYESQLLQSPGRVSQVVCSGENPKLCCSFTLETKFDEKLGQSIKHYYQYRIVAFSGVRSFDGVYNGGIEVCGVIACLNSTLASCGRRFQNYEDITWPITFDEISIKANFTVDDNRIQFPNSVLSNLRPLQSGSIDWSSQKHADGKIIARTLKLKAPQNRLMTFAIYGRDFSRDSAP